MKAGQVNILHPAQVHPPPASTFRGFEQYVDDLNVLAGMGSGSQAAPEAAGAQTAGPERRYVALRGFALLRKLLQLVACIALHADMLLRRLYCMFGCSQGTSGAIEKIVAACSLCRVVEVRICSCSGGSSTKGTPHTRKAFTTAWGVHRFRSASQED